MSTAPSRTVDVAKGAVALTRKGLLRDFMSFIDTLEDERVGNNGVPLARLAKVEVCRLLGILARQLSEKHKHTSFRDGFLVFADTIILK